MAGVSNSSIQAWLDFRGDKLPATIAPCQARLTWKGAIAFVNCTRVCNSILSLLDHNLPNNLLPCGLWSSLTTLDYHSSLLTTKLRDHVQALLQSFGRLGLDASNAIYAYAAGNAVSTSMSILDKVTRMQTYQGDQYFRGACNEQILFSTYSITWSMNFWRPSQACVENICSPRTLNPDLGGVGVSDPCQCNTMSFDTGKVLTSLLMQLIVAIICVVALIGLEIWPSSRKREKRDHSLALSIALVEFHKYQSYFMSAIEIAALVLRSLPFKLTRLSMSTARPRCSTSCYLLHCL
jgi:hypothetical protein